MDPVTSRTFHLLSAAPAEHVWAALTCPQLSPRFLQGTSVDGSWQPGSPLTFTDPNGATRSGQVLWAQPPTRLSFSLEDTAGRCTYLTWQLRGTPQGTVVRLRVEDNGQDGADDETLEDTWLPALTALEAVLQS